MCDYSLEHYRSRPAQLGERYETHQFESRSIGFVAPGDPSTAVCMACDTTLRLENVPEAIQRRYGVSATEDVTFTRLEDGPHHDGVRFTNGAELTLQELGAGVTGYLVDALSSPVWKESPPSPKACLCEASRLERKQEHSPKRRVDPKHRFDA